MSVKTDIPPSSYRILGHLSSRTGFSRGGDCPAGRIPQAARRGRLGKPMEEVEKVQRNPSAENNSVAPGFPARRGDDNNLVDDPLDAFHARHGCLGHLLEVVTGETTAQD